MEGNKLEISGRVTTDSPPASYKQITDTDVKERPKSLTKSSKSNSEMDGADEQMLPKDEKSSDMKVDIGDITFTSNEKQNGEAKLDIGEEKSAFVGMTKEELMKYANDPFWVRLRWILFVSFWLLWLAMLIGAIIIIIAAPKCAPPTPRTWFEEGPLTEVASDIDTKDLKILKENKIKAIIVAKVDDSYKTANESTDLVDLIQRAKEANINVIIELSPAASSLWFNKSVEKEEPYSDYYIWSNYNNNNSTGSPIPPNNWLSPSGGSAWKYVDSRDEFYYAPNGKPHLNFRNQDVVNEFSNIILQWLTLGVAGIRLRGAPTLLVHEKLNDEPTGNIPGPVHTDYSYYKHRGTTINVEGLGNVLNEWKNVIREHTNNKGPLLAAEDIYSLDAYLVNDTLSIDLPRHSKLFFSPEKLNNASLIYSGLNSAFTVLQSFWPLWQYDENSTALPSDVLDIVIMLLPGSPLISKDININPELLKIRNVPSMLHGETQRDLLANNTVFAFTRVAAGNPGYLIACNPTENLVRVDFTSMKNMSDDVTIQVLSANFNVTLHDIPKMEPNLKIPANDVHLPPKSAIVLTYVPKSS